MDDERIDLLIDFIETFLVLNEQERKELDAMLALPENKDVREFMSYYEQRGFEKGMKAGIVCGKRDSLLRQMQHKFGTLPEGVESRVEAVTDSEELDRLMDRLWTAETLEQMELPERSENSSES